MGPTAPASGAVKVILAMALASVALAQLSLGTTCSDIFNSKGLTALNQRKPSL